MVNADKLSIRKEDVLQFLGIPEGRAPEDLDGLVDEMIDEALELAQPRMVSRTGKILRNGEGLSLLGVPLSGEGIQDFLDGSDSAVMMAVTIGLDIERRIKQYELTDMTKALVLDACASAAVEALADMASDGFEAEAAVQGLFTTERFSPGYSDLPLSIQPKVLEALNALRRIGLSCSETCLLFPRKSVTAIIGLRSSPREPRGLRCEKCLLRDKCKHGICSFERTSK